MIKAMKLTKEVGLDMKNKLYKDAMNNLYK